MAADNIRTRWQRVQAAFEAGAVGVQVGRAKPIAPALKGSDRYETIADLLTLVDDMPKYFIESNLMEELETNRGLSESLKAMHQAKITRLPFPYVMVEVEGTSKVQPQQVRNFVVLSERRESSLLMPSEEMWHPFRANLFRLTTHEGQDTLLFAPATFWLGYTETADAGEGKVAFGTHYISAHAPYMPDNAETKTSVVDVGDKDFHACRKALDAMMVLLNTRGIDKEIVEPTKLNKARKKAGKKLIPRHHVIRLGHAYSNDGQKREGIAWHQQFHIRPGYINWYWYGPRTEGHKSGERRPKFVESYVINAPTDPTIKPNVPMAHLRS